jgi:hypothetical protein
MIRLRTRLGNEHGTALIIALMAMMLLTALGAGVVMVSNTETAIASNYRNAQEGLYGADAAAERVVQDLLLVPRWNDILGGLEHSSFVDGGPEGQKTIPGGGRITLSAAGGGPSATAELQRETDTANLWGANNPQWRLFAWGPLSEMLPGGNDIDSPMYVAVWVGDDPADNDNDPLSDSNGTLTLHAEAYGPSGTRKVVEVTVARTSGTEIERGQIAQRGQEELNQRARKAAVQTPGKSLTNMQMRTGTGGLVVQP